MSKQSVVLKCKSEHVGFARRRIAGFNIEDGKKRAGLLSSDCETEVLVVPSCIWSRKHRTQTLLPQWQLACCNSGKQLQ